MAVTYPDVAGDVEKLFGTVAAERRRSSLLTTATLFQDVDIYTFDFPGDTHVETIWDDALDVRTGCL